MRILVIGAYGLIGSYVTARLLADGHEIVAAGRDVRMAVRRWPQVRWIRVDLGRMTVADWQGRLDGVDAVVNCAGALQDSPSDRLAAVHRDGVLALAEACRVAGVRRFVQISALGVERTRGVFAETKREADEALMATSLDWVVIRPGLVLSPGAFGGSALLRGLAALPLAIPAVHTGRTVQSVSVDDLAACVAAAVRPDAPARVLAALSADDAPTLADLLRALRAWLGLPPAPVIAVPAPFASAASLAADAIAWLGWRSALRSTALGQLAQGVQGETSEGARTLGFIPRTLDQLLASWPSTVQDRWFARLYFVKPLAILVLAAFWIGSGVIALVSLLQAAEQLGLAGFSPAGSRATVEIGAAVDIALGVLVCLRRPAPVALKGMVLVSLAYVIGACLWRRDLWLDPLGPLLKVLPGAVLALMTLAVLEER
ncbi:MAG: SDR family oxidoreductase [Caulobacteraceae bacterium]